MDKKFLEDLKEKNHLNEDGTREGLYESFYENGEVYVKNPYTQTHSAKVE